VRGRYGADVAALAPSLEPIEAELLSRHFKRKHGEGAYYGPSPRLSPRRLKAARRPDPSPWGKRRDAATACDPLGTKFAQAREIDHAAEVDRNIRPDLFGRAA